MCTHMLHCLQCLHCTDHGIPPLPSFHCLHYTYSLSHKMLLIKQLLYRSVLQTSLVCHLLAFGLKLAPRQGASTLPLLPRSQRH